MACQRMAAAIPLVEGAHHADPAGGWRPEREIDACNPLFGFWVRAQFGEQRIEFALLEGVAVGGGEGRFVDCVRIMEGISLTISLDHSDLIVQLGYFWNANREQTLQAQALHFVFAAAGFGYYVGAFGLRQ